MDGFIIGYLGRSPSGLWEIQSDNGRTMGPASIVGSWKPPRNCVSVWMFQVEACIGGKLYSGRCAGRRMSWRGKILRRPRKRDSQSVRFHEENASRFA